MLGDQKYRGACFFLLGNAFETTGARPGGRGMSNKGWARRRGGGVLASCDSFDDSLDRLDTLDCLTCAVAVAGLRLIRSIDCVSILSSGAGVASDGLRPAKWPNVGIGTTGDSATSSGVSTVKVDVSDDEQLWLSSSKVSVLSASK